VLALFAAISLPIFAWAIALLVVYISQYILRLNLWETVGVVAYVLAYALLETLIVFAVVMAILLILPARLHSNKTIPLTATYLTLTTLLVVFLNVTQETAIVRGKLTETFIALGVYLVLMVVATLVIRRSARIAGLISGLLDRLVPLALLYGFFAVVGVIIVIVRNVAA
jgi:hypothetical protein